VGGTRNSVRDAEIYNKYKNGAKKIELSKEYGLSYMRIEQIIRYRKAIEEHSNPNSMNRPTEREKVFLAMIHTLGESQRHIICRLMTGFDRRFLGKTNMKRVLSLSKNDILDMRGCGDKAADLFERFKSIMGVNS